MQSLPLDLWTAGLLIWGWLFSATASWMAMKWLQVYGTFSSYCFAMGIFAWLHRWKIRGKFLRLQKLCGGWLFHDPSVLKIISRVLLSLMVMLICIHCSVQTRTFISLSSFLKSQIIYFYQIKIQRSLRHSSVCSQIWQTGILQVSRETIKPPSAKEFRWVSWPTRCLCGAWI